MSQSLKFIILLSFLVFNSCGTTTEEIEIETKGTVIQSISEKFDINNDDITVKEYTLVQESGNVYIGALKTEYNDIAQQWGVKVVWDHSTDEYVVEWELLDGSLQQKEREDTSAVASETAYSAEAEEVGQYQSRGDNWHLGSWYCDVVYSGGVPLYELVGEEYVESEYYIDFSEGTQIGFKFFEDGLCEIFLTVEDYGENPSGWFKTEYKKTATSIIVDYPGAPSGYYLIFPTGDEILYSHFMDVFFSGNVDETIKKPEPQKQKRYVEFETRDVFRLGMEIFPPGTNLKIYFDAIEIDDVRYSSTTKLINKSSSRINFEFEYGLETLILINFDKKEFIISPAYDKSDRYNVRIEEVGDNTEKEVGDNTEEGDVENAGAEY